MYPVDERGTRKYQPRQGCPEGMDPAIWKGFNEEERRNYLAPAQQMQRIISVAAAARRVGPSRIADPDVNSGKQTLAKHSIAQLLLCTAAMSAANPGKMEIINNLAEDDHVVSVPCAPMGWNSIFGSQPTECIASPNVKHHMPSAPAAGTEAPPGASGHIRAEPPWVQFDRDANDSLIC